VGIQESELTKKGKGLSPVAQEFERIDGVLDSLDISISELTSRLVPVSSNKDSEKIPADASLHDVGESELRTKLISIHDKLLADHNRIIATMESLEV